MVRMLKVDKEEEREERGIFSREEYRRGGEGMIKWCEEFVRVPVFPEYGDQQVWWPLGDLPTRKHPDTQRSYRDLWNWHKDILREALEMKEERFLFRLIVLCWERGEGKSLLAVLIQMWKFFCWTRQLIVLGANSKDQVKFVHYDIIVDVIMNSPELFAAIGGRKYLQEKAIKLKDSRGAVRSTIRPLSSFTGIVSNITGYTFSEMFDMKNPKFFVQLDGSVRNIPNALGVIDSTVSDKTHVLYQLYQNVLIKKKLKDAYFSYYCSKEKDYRNYHNPMMTQQQLESYELKFPLGDFERYFLNLWEAGQVKGFSEAALEEMGYMGVDGQWLNHMEVKKAVEEKLHWRDVVDQARQKKWTDGAEETERKISVIEQRLIKTDSIYKLEKQFGGFIQVGAEKLNEIGDRLDTDWLILGGLDLADPLSTRSPARSIVTIIAKCLPFSRNNIAVLTSEINQLRFLYLVLAVIKVEGHNLNVVKDIMEEIIEEYDGVDAICSEKFAAWDMVNWCEEREIQFETLYAAYEKQREAFRELATVLMDGRFKCPPVPVEGSKSTDILREELSVFYHDTVERWFGSPQKDEKYGIQDDVVYSVGWTMYGGRLLGPDKMRPRKKQRNFGMFMQDRAMLGRY